MRSIIAAVTLSFTATFAVAPAHADTEGRDLAGPAGYVGAAAGLGFRQRPDILPAGTDFDPSVGANLFGGYRWNRWLATELQVEILTGASLDVGLETYDIESLSLTGNVKGYVPLLNGRVQPYALLGLGLGQQWVDSDSFTKRMGFTGFAARFGGGVDIWLARKLALTVGAAYVLGTGDLDGANYTAVNIGLTLALAPD